MAVPTIKLSNDTEMPVLGFGVFQVKPGPETAAAVTSALEAGYTSIDTAAAYGNEEGVGQALAEADIPREQLFITTKLWNEDQGYESALKAFDASIEKLGLDYVDLYLIHWPKPDKSADSWRALEEIYASGRAKAIGVSNYLPHHLDELAKTATVTPMVNQIELHPRLAQAELRTYHQQHGIVTEAWSPLMQAGELLSEPVITKLAEAYDKTPAQIVLRWHVQLGNVAIPKSVNPDRIKANIDIFDFELSATDMASIATLNTGHRIGPDPDNISF